MRFKELLPYITPHRHSLLEMLALLVLGSLLSLANPWMAGLFAANVLGEGKLVTDTGQLLGLWFLLMLFSTGISFVTSYRSGLIGERLTADLRVRLYQQLQALPISYYQQRRSGETLSLLSTDATIISSFVTDTAIRLLPALLTLSGAFLLMAWLDITLTLLAALLLPVYVIAMKMLGRRLRPLSRAWVEANSGLVSVVSENLSMLPAIKAFTRESHEQKRFDNANTQLLGVARRQLWTNALLGPAIGLLGGLGLLGLLWLGTSHIESGRLDPSQLVTVLLYALLLMSPLRTLANVYGQVQRTRGSAERILAFLGEQPERVDQGNKMLSGIKGHIRFEKLSFGYPGRPDILIDFNLEIAAGETIAITGANGAGKSTLAHLLMRYADPSTGRILIDGVDIRDARLASLRRQIGLVAQHVLLLNGTVADNIAYANPGVELGQVERAARIARAHEFVEQLPLGYDTVIGEQGVRLSGGQRQRVSLARTLLQNPPILILDEATAMFDPEGERAFIDQSRELLETRTVLLITHRPASLALADRVIRLIPPEEVASIPSVPPSQV